MRKLYFLIWMIGCGSIASASNPIAVKDSLKNRGAKNSIYAELLGSGAYASINYERFFIQKEKLQVLMRLGVNPFVDYPDFNNYEFYFPHTISIILGKRKNKLELGLGVLYRFDTSPNPRTKTERENYVFDGGAPYSPPFEVFPNLIVGYRFQPLDKGILFRISFTPLLNRVKPVYRYFSNDLIFLWGGISIGYKF